MKKLPKPKYPKRYRKVTPPMLKEILSLHDKGWGDQEIADMFGLARTTVKRKWDKEAHERALAGTRKWLKIYMKDPEYVRRVNESVRKNIAERYHTDKKYNEFLKKYSLADKINRKEYLKKYSRAYYFRKKKELQLLKRHHSVNVKTPKTPHKTTKIGRKR